MHTDVKVLSLAEIEAADDLEYATIPAYKEGEFFRIRSVTAGDMVEWSGSDETKRREAGLRLIVKSLVDGNGDRLIRANPQDEDLGVALFRKKSHKKTEQIVKAILALNGMQVKDKDEAKKDKGGIRGSAWRIKWPWR